MSRYISDPIFIAMSVLELKRPACFKWQKGPHWMGHFFTHVFFGPRIKRALSQSFSMCRSLRAKRMRVHTHVCRLWRLKGSYPIIIRTKDTPHIVINFFFQKIIKKKHLQRGYCGWGNLFVQFTFMTICEVFIWILKGKNVEVFIFENFTRNGTLKFFLLFFYLEFNWTFWSVKFVNYFKMWALFTNRLWQIQVYVFYNVPMWTWTCATISTYQN